MPTNPRPSLLPACAAGIGLLLACAGAPAGPPPPSPALSPLARGQSSRVQDAFLQVRAATAPFVSLDAAVAAGYAREVPRCYVDSHHGAMGYHHLNRSYLDTRAEVERPEILLYERMGDGRYALNGVEYIIPFRLWPRDSVAPTIMGETMKQENELQLWYLHMWIWKENPAGLFADWNPAVQCR